MALVLALVLAGGTLHGTVLRGPTKPVCAVGASCSEPAVGAVLLFERRGRIVARVRVGVRGRYTVRLAAGAYDVLLAKRPQAGFGIRPGAVRVVRGRTRRVDFAIDTGIR